MPRNDGKLFERAVQHFLAALASDARVTRDQHEPDKHTGILRQRDVWIEAKLFGFFPITVLVSCKDHRRKLSQSHVDAFHGELHSSHAHVGVLYSTSGFSMPAILKAKSLGIHLCRMYQGQASDVPEMLIVPVCYCVVPRYRFSFRSPVPAEFLDLTVEDVFGFRIDDGHQSASAFEWFCRLCRRLEDTEVARESRHLLAQPKDVCETFDVRSDSGTSPLRIKASVQWSPYVGKLSASLVDGTYVATEGTFCGRQCLPTIDMHGPHPGSGWDEIDRIPDFLNESGASCMAVLRGPNSTPLAEQSSRGMKVRDLIEI